MLKYTRTIVIITLLLTVVSLSCAYVVPKAQFKIYYPRGFDVSIPADAGTSLFAFHGQLHEKMDDPETGRWAKYIMTPENGSFVFRERNTSLRFGDTIYYRTDVVNNGLEYREENGSHTVSVYTPQFGHPSPPIRLRLPMIPIPIEARSMKKIVNTTASNVENSTLSSNRSNQTSRLEDTQSSIDTNTVPTLTDNTSSSSTATTIASLILFNIVCLLLNL